MTCIVLDRDGVINKDSDDYIKSAEEWAPIDGSLEAIATLTASGYRVAIATNQSGLARGLFDEYALAKIHQKLCASVEDEGGFIEGIFFCPHGPDESCSCRKPNTGLLRAINNEFHLDADTTWMVGDTAKDVECADRMGIRAALVKTGKGQEELRKGVISRETTPIFENLNDFVDWLIACH